MLATVQDMALFGCCCFFFNMFSVLNTYQQVKRLKHDHTSAQHFRTDLFPAFLSIFSNSHAMLLQVIQSPPCGAGQHQHAQNYWGSHDMTSNTAGFYSPRVWIMLTAFSLSFLLLLFFFFMAHIEARRDLILSLIVTNATSGCVDTFMLECMFLAELNQVLQL